MNIAVIPARGGSKRIPRKNIKLFCGKPMIAYAITAAQNTGLFNHIVVSTDDIEIAEVAQQWGAEVPFMRPPQLADDYTGTVPVIAHAIQALQQKYQDINYVCCIYPATPLIQETDIKAALELLIATEAPYAFPITQFPSAVQRSLKRDKNGRVRPFYPEFEQTRTQDLEPAYHDAGQFYWGSKDTWLTLSSIYPNGTGLTISPWRVVDIDDLNDWHRAEIVYKILDSEVSSESNG